MTPMTIPQLCEKLSSEQFQNPRNIVYYNYYIFLYDPAKEYEIRQQIKEMKDSLIRPNTFIDIPVLNLFEEFCNFLDKQPFGKFDSSYLHFMLEHETPEYSRILSIKAGSNDFMNYIQKRIDEEINKADEYVHPYVFIYGIGSMYPYLRANDFLTKYEGHNDPSRYKIILFYPGSIDGNSYSLFNKLHDQHGYRSISLINK